MLVLKDAMKKETVPLCTLLAGACFVMQGENPKDTTKIKMVVCEYGDEDEDRHYIYPFKPNIRVKEDLEYYAAEMEVIPVYIEISDIRTIL